MGWISLKRPAPQWFLKAPSPGRSRNPTGMVHIGSKIKEEMQRQGHTPGWLAARIHCQRTNIYYIYSQPSINTDLLLLISRALRHNFFRHFTDEAVLNPS